MKSVYFTFVQATLTELRRDTSRVVRAADNGEEVILTEHGEPRYKLQRVQAIDRKVAAAALRAIGPVTFCHANEIPPGQQRPVGNVEIKIPAR
jgi:prevent-host-death family protein